MKKSQLFSFQAHEVFTPTIISPSKEIIRSSSEDVVSKGLFRNEDVAPSNSSDEFGQQFFVFQLSSKADQPSVLDSSKVIPTIKGSDDNPDVLVNLEMLSFCLGESDKEGIDKNTRATMRINMGKDQNSTDKLFDTAFWSVAAGLNLFNESKKKVSDAKDLKADIKQALGRRPIEIPGSLSMLQFEIVKHKEPKWWQRIFNFMQTDTGKMLISTIGFPAITQSAISVIDELLNRLDDSSPEILFKSRPLRLALSEKAKDDFTGGNERVKTGSLNPGFCVLARGNDFKKLVDSDVFYYPSFGKLVPSGIEEAEILSGSFNDPLKDVTYAVFRVGMKETKLDPTFNFR